MGDLTQNLSRAEFACKCRRCRMDHADIILVHAIQEAATYLGMRYHVTPVVIITSGNRCIVHNAKSGGSPDSKHTHGIAADHYMKGIPATALYEYYDMKYPNKYGLGLYKGRVHLDVRSDKARWDLSK